MSLQIGTDIGDINREIKKLLRDLVNGDETALQKITKLSRKKEELLKSKRFRK